MTTYGMLVWEYKSASSGEGRFVIKEVTQEDRFSGSTVGATLVKGVYYKETSVVLFAGEYFTPKYTYGAVDQNWSTKNRVAAITNHMQRIGYKIKASGYPWYQIIFERS